MDFFMRYGCQCENFGRGLRVLAHEFAYRPYLSGRCGHLAEILGFLSAISMVVLAEVWTIPVDNTPAV
jgi:hypothetical protein